MDTLQMQPVENGFVVGPAPEEPARPDALSAESIMALIIDRLSIQVSVDVVSGGSGIAIKTKVFDRMRPDYALCFQSDALHLLPMGVQPQFRKSENPF